MRHIILATSLLAAPMLFSSGAFAQDSNSPMSNSASHIAGTPGKSMAPRLPVSAPDGSADSYLHQAAMALHAGHTGVAQEALERAETRLLDRVTDPSMAAAPDNSPRVAHVHEALQALGHGDRKGAEQAVQAALATPDMAAIPSAAPAMVNTAGSSSISTMPAPAVPAMPTTSVLPGTTSSGNHPLASFSGGTTPVN